MPLLGLLKMPILSLWETDSPFPVLMHRAAQCSPISIKYDGTALSANSVAVLESFCLKLCKAAAS